MVEDHRHLAIELTSCAVPVLPLDPHRVLPLLGERQVINYNHAPGAAEVLTHQSSESPPDFAFIPGALVYEVLQRLSGVFNLCRGGKMNLPGQSLDILAASTEEQALQVDL
jgi:hypothetical protein